MIRYTLPRDTFHGRGALEALKDLKGTKAMLVIGGSSMKKAGVVDKVIAYLKEAGIETQLFEGVEPDPSVETVMKGAAQMRDFQPDWIVAMGGGSPIDAAKAMWLFYEYPEETFEQAVVPFSLPTLRNKAKFCAISTTSGTATEVTAFAVITDYASGVKYPLADFNLTPDVAIVDPDLTETMPPKLVSFTGMDAITHAFEAYVACFHSPFTDPLAIHAIKMIFKNLENSFKGDMDAREQMHYAQCLAGQAFSNALLGLVHSMAHKTGAAFSTGHIPHGCANAIYLPFVIQFNAKDPIALARYGEIGKELGIEGTDQECVNEMCARIDAINVRMGIPQTLQAFGIVEAEFLEKVEHIAEVALTDACTGCNPRACSKEEMVKLLTCTYYGTPVTF